MDKIKEILLLNGLALLVQLPIIMFIEKGGNMNIVKEIFKAYIKKLKSFFKKEVLKEILLISGLTLLVGLPPFLIVNLFVVIAINTLPVLAIIIIGAMIGATTITLLLVLASVIIDVLTEKGIV